MPNRKFFEAAAIIIGTIIGVGIFGLPYIASQTGFIVMVFYFLIIGVIVFLINLFYGEIVLRTKRKKRLPGYVKKYLGRRWEIISFISAVFGLSGALLAYLIIGADFLAALFSPIFGGSVLICALIYFALAALLIYLGIKSIAQVEFFTLILFALVLLFFLFKGIPLIKINNFTTFNSHYLFLPYGAVLFSLCGFAVVPETKEILKNDKKYLKKILFLSVLVPAIVYLFFVFIVLGINGNNASPETISGLKEVLSNEVIILILLFGVLATFTSFITLGLTLKKIFYFNLKINEHLSWFLACFIPFALYLIGFKNFITVISLTGGIAISVDAIIIILTYLKAKKMGDQKPAYNLKISSRIVYSLIVFFVLAIIYEIYYFVK